MRGSDPGAFFGQLRAMAASVDPTLQVYDLHTAADVEYGRRKMLIFVGLGILTVTASVVLLSGAGIYSAVAPS